MDLEGEEIAPSTFTQPPAPEGLGLPNFSHWHHWHEGVRGTRYEFTDLPILGKPGNKQLKIPHTYWPYTHANLLALRWYLEQLPRQLP